MLGRIKQIAWGALFGCLIATQALGQATLLPNAKQQFFTPQGIPAASGTVDMFIPNTNPPQRKTTWKSSTETTGNQNTNPVLLDAGGFAVIYGDGSYRQVVKDADGNTIWDAITASTGSGGGGGGVNPATGDGNLVGTVLAWSGWRIPNQYMVADGTIISRTTYPELLAALTQTVNVICTIGLPTLTGLANTVQVPIGATVEASCLAPGSTVIAKGTNSLTMSNNASVSTAVSAQIFFFGDGDRSTTFNLPDLRSTVVAGQDTSPNRGARNVLVPPYFPLNGLGAPSISVTASLTTPNLPAITPAGTISNGAIVNTVTGGTLGATGTNTAVAAGGVQLLTGASAIIVSSAQATSTFTGSVGGGTSAPFGIVQPTMMLNYIIKVTPDANSSVATGVLSLGGMTGAIACGPNLTCTGNIINTTTGSVNSPGSATPGNIAFWLDSAATTLGASPSYLAANPGNASLYSQIANAANLTVSNNALQISVGTPIPAGQQEGYNLSTSPTQQAIVGTARIGTSDTTTHGGIGVSGYAITGSPTGGAGAVAVGIFGQGATTVANASVFGGNTIVTNSDGGAPGGVVNSGFNLNFSGGFEADTNHNKLSGGADPTVTGGFGIGVAGGGTSAANQGDGYRLDMLSVITGAKWINGYRTLAGAAVSGFVAGPAALGATQNSQPVVLQSTNGASTVLSAKIFSDSAGSVIIDPSAFSAVNLRDGSGTVLFSTGSGFGGSGVKVNSFATAGIVTNTSAGVLGTLAGTVTTLLHGNAAGLPTYSAVDLTADVTNSLPAVNGGTGQTAYVLGDTLYSPSANTLFRLPGNITAAKQYLSQTGTGAVSAAPTWATITGADITGAALTAANDTNITLTLGGTPSTALLRAASITVAWTGTLANSRLATMATNTVKGNATSGTASPTDLAVGSCDTATKALQWTTNTGFVCNTSITAAAVPASGLTGATLASGVTGSSLTSVGTLTSGTAGTGFVLAGVTVTVGSDGTGDIHYRNSGGIFTRLAIGSTGNVLTVAGGLPSWAAPGAAAAGSLTGATLAAGVTASSLTSLGTITSLTATTINAFTLGGTISGGGNQINNVIIGNSTPLAGTFTALTANTSLSVTGTALFTNTAAAGAVNIDFQNNTASAVGDEVRLRLGISTSFIAAPTLSPYISAVMTNSGTAASAVTIGTWNGSSLIEGARVNSSGGVSIGNTTDPGVGSLQMNAQIFAPNMASDTATVDSTVCTASTGGKFLKGTGALGICLGTSGAQFKTAFAPMVGGVDDIARLNFQNYRYREGYGDGGARVQYGLTAQDVEAVMPDLVRHDASGATINFDSGALLFIGLRAIQQLKATNDNLETRMTRLESRK